MAKKAAVVCARTPARIAAALSARRLSTAGETLIPVATGVGGETLALVSTANTKTVELISTQNRRTRIMTVANPATDQLTGASIASGTIAFFISHNPSDPNLWTLYRYDRASASLVRVTDNPGGAAHPVDGPFPQAVQVNQGVYWIQGARGQETEIRRLDASSGAVTVLHTGHADVLFRFGNSLYWMESVKADAPAIAQTHAAPALPAAAASALAGAVSVDYTGQSLAWIGYDGHTIHRWDRRTSTAVVLYVTPTDLAAWDIHQFGDWITWATSDKPFAFDVTSSTVFPLTPNYGYVLASADNLVVAYPPSGSGKDGSALKVEQASGAEMPSVSGC